MKKITFLLVIIFGTFKAVCQDCWNLTSHSGVNITFKNFVPHFSPPEGGGLLGIAFWDRQVFFTQQLGLTYDTPKFSILGAEHSSSLELGFSIQNMGGFDNATALYIYQDIYIPKKISSRKLEGLIGIRNNFLVLDNLEIGEENKKKHYVLGLNMALRYQLNSNVKMGMRAYFDLSPYIASDLKISGLSDIRYRKAELLLSFIYRLNTETSN